MSSITNLCLFVFFTLYFLILVYWKEIKLVFVFKYLKHVNFCSLLIVKQAQNKAKVKGSRYSIWTSVSLGVYMWLWVFWGGLKCPWMSKGVLKGIPRLQGLFLTTFISKRCLTKKCISRKLKSLIHFLITIFYFA
jgi:hypothetical protein